MFAGPAIDRKKAIARRLEPLLGTLWVSELSLYVTADLQWRHVGALARCSRGRGCLHRDASADCLTSSYAV